MKTLKSMWLRFFPSGRTALDKRRHERLLRENGLTRADATRITYQYFKN